MTSEQIKALAATVIAERLEIFQVVSVDKKGRAHVSRFGAPATAAELQWEALLGQGRGMFG